MKMKSLLLITLFLGANYSMAQESSVTKTPSAQQSVKGMSSEGFRVSLLKTFLDAKLTASAFGVTGSATTKADAIGAGIGYAYLPVQNIGWTANLAYLNLKSSDAGSSLGLMRADGNMAFAMNNFVNIKGGLNFSKFVSGSDIKDLNPAIGFQAGLGIQATQNFGVDIGYVEMNQSGNVSGINVDTKFSGLEIGLNGTF